MNKRAQKIRLGIFIAVSSAILIGIVGYFTARQFLEKSDNYYVVYEGVSVGGLEVGSPVKYLGIKVGSISDIRISPDDVNSVIVELSLKPGTPVKQDAKADIVTMGITGLKSIEISGGSNEAPLLEEGNRLQSGSSMSEEITGRAEVIAEKAEKVLNNLQQFTDPESLGKFTEMADKIGEVVMNAGEAIARIDELVTANQNDINKTVILTQEIAESLRQTTLSLETAAARVNRYIASDSIGVILGNAQDISQKLKESNLKELIENLARVADETGKLLVRIDSDINRTSNELLQSQELLRLTLENLNEASQKINRNPSILIRPSVDKNPPDEKLKN